MHSLKSTWRSVSNKHKLPDFDSAGHEATQGDGEQDGGRLDRLVVAHFMLGNTYPFTEQDWEDTLGLAMDTGLDGLALNLGPEEWQYTQALSAFSVLSRLRPRSSTSASAPFSLFLSMDMNVLPCSTEADGQALRDKASRLLKEERYLHWKGRRVLSTFGGQGASFGGAGWGGWLRSLKQELGEKVMFWPAFFLPPETILSLPYVDGAFAWNNAWPSGDAPIDTQEDEPFLRSEKPYMAAVSPVFSTHYGAEGAWAFNKWVTSCPDRSDDLLYPTRWQQLLDLPRDASPEIIQVISWNDFGESHYIAPIRGAQPGSEAWTEGMEHEAFREMTRWFANRWRRGATSAHAGQGAADGSAEFDVDGENRDEVRVWGWWRTHPSDVVASDDPVGRPTHAEWARDLLNFVILIPHNHSQSRHSFRVHNGNKHEMQVNAGLNTFTIPFVPGSVSFELAEQGQVVLRGEGRAIERSVQKYNFNFWSGSWRVEA
ncbi:hypothetical protein JCM24511_02972 [Saitozyma sp. JCM 24511]|nr:hypothetical protein JCM24511_02972 [Saitozyma sp. JCM 24511]